MSDSNIFSLYDDPVFPTTRLGQEAMGVFESVKDDKEKKCEGGVCESADSVTVFAQQQARQNAMSAVLGWKEEGDFSFQALDEYIIGIADLDGDFEVSESEQSYYNEIWAEIPDALLTLGASEEDVTEFVNGEDDKAGALVGNSITKTLDELEADDDEIIVGFAMGEEAVFENASDDMEEGGRHMVLEATYKKQKVVRGGKVQIVKKRVAGKVHLSAKQKAAIRKMQRKSHTAGANLARKKSMRIRENRGM